MQVSVSSATPIRSSMIDGILGDIPRELFLRDYLGQKFLPLPGPPSRFAQLLTWSDINNILETQMFSPATLRMKKAGLDVPTDSFLTEYSKPNRPGRTTRVSARVITREMREGATLIINEIQNSWPPVRALSEDLEEALGAQINVNMYASLHESHGFVCHYDTHDVLVLQVDGRKHWQVFDRRPITPFADEAFDPKERPQIGNPMWNEILTAGDALYLPRGYWHFAKPIGEPTIHLTVGIINPTGRDLLRWVVDFLSSTELFRRNVPRCSSTSAQAEYVASIQSAVVTALSRPDLLPSFLRDRVINDGAIPRIHFGLPWSATDSVLPPHPDAIIHITAPHGLKAYDAPEGGEMVQLYQEGKPGPQFRKRVEPLCEYLMSAAPVSICTFTDHFESEFDVSTLHAFLRDLATSGLIAVKTKHSRQADHPYGTTARRSSGGVTTLSVPDFDK